MKRVLSIAVVALLVCLIPVLAAAAETEKVHKTVPLGPGGTLKLNNFSGQVRIVGADVSEVTIDAVRTATRDRLDHIKLDVSSSGSTVTIEANKKDEGWDSRNNNVVETEMDIQVPKQAVLKIKVFSSGVTVRGVTGEQTIETFSGATRVEGGAARIAAKTFSAPVTILMASTGSAADLNVETFSGDIELRVPDGARAGISFDSFSGQLTSDHAVTIREQKRGHLVGDLNGGDAQHTVRLKTFSGDVKIGR